jgi:UDP-N-acetylglucosamine:LPS N-acetylglucosamine transferase
MATVFLPLNGIGLGHIARSHAVAEYMLGRGGHPIMLVQGHYPDFFARSVPGISIPTIYKANQAGRLQIADEIIRYARTTNTRVIVEDTHPSPIALPATLRRVLLVRPTAIEYMRHLCNVYSHKYSNFVITDHPDSPTWPYSESETVEIKGWDTWTCAGPVFRWHCDNKEQFIRYRYNLNEEQAFYVFTMGGGGAQKDVQEEARTFLGQSVAVARVLRESEPGCRLIFVRGPLFPRDITIPVEFEDVLSEPEMPALLAASTGAVIRPGFNTTWECLAGRTPFLSIPGLTFMEPVSNRQSALAVQGLSPRDVKEWLDPLWRKQFMIACGQTVARWNPAHALAHIYSKVTNSVDTTTSHLAVDVSANALGYEASVPFLLRIDDVFSLDRNLMELLEFCIKRALCPSLEIIPYLAETDESQLDSIFGSSLRYEVSQHGFAHLPRHTSSGRRTEILDEPLIIDQLRIGLEMLRNRFPTRYKGGFSAPYDYVFPTFPDEWHAIGGRYISFCSHQCRPSLLPVIRQLLDPWNWSRGMPIDWTFLSGAARRSIELHGHVGIAIHPVLFDIPGERDRTFAILDRLLEHGCAPRLIGECASSLT